jgi:hypothetical protein
LRSSSAVLEPFITLSRRTTGWIWGSFLKVYVELGPCRACPLSSLFSSCAPCPHPPPFQNRASDQFSVQSPSWFPVCRCRLLDRSLLPTSCIRSIDRSQRRRFCDSRIRAPTAPPPIEFAFLSTTTIHPRSIIPSRPSCPPAHDSRNPLIVPHPLQSLVVPAPF